MEETFDSLYENISDDVELVAPYVKGMPRRGRRPPCFQTNVRNVFDLVVNRLQYAINPVEEWRKCF